MGNHARRNISLAVVDNEMTQAAIIMVPLIPNSFVKYDFLQAEEKSTFESRNSCNSSFVYSNRTT